MKPKLIEDDIAQNLSILSRLSRLESIKPGQEIDFKRINGAEEAYSASFTTALIPITDRAGAGAINMRLAYTPPVDCWWEVNGNIGIVQKIDAAYHYAYGVLQLAPADVDGISLAMQLAMQHNAVQTFEGRNPRRRFKLAAGIPYTVDLGIADMSGGTWQYYCGPGYLWLEATAITR